MELEFYEAAIIAGIALIGPFVAGLVAFRIARLQIKSSEAQALATIRSQETQTLANIEQARLQSLRDARRDKIELALAVITKLPTELSHSLVDWIDAGKASQEAIEKGDSNLLNAATGAIQNNPMNRRLVDEIGQASIVLKLYMPDSVPQITEIMNAYSKLSGDDRTRGKVWESSPILASQLMKEFGDATQVPVAQLMEQAKALVTE